MNLLLDTCAFLWLVLEPKKLSARAVAEITNPTNPCYLSSASAWEIAIAYSLRRLAFAQPPDVFVPAQRAGHGIDLLPLSEEAALQAATLPKLHRDPFDRILVCQATVHQPVVLTPDPLIQQYSQIKWLW